MRKILTIAVVAMLGIALATPLMAQPDLQFPGLKQPRTSPVAWAGQTFGVTDVEVTYSRPAVNERTIWGGLVPYDQVWRTGADENTTITFSTDVTVEGKALAAGTYGLHTIPGEDSWQVIFSNDSDAWGSYSYDEANDALRVTVTPAAAPHAENFTVAFADVNNESVDVVLHWAELAVPVTIGADTHALALASFESELKGVDAFFWRGWNQAAQYVLNNDLEVAKGLEFVEQSIQTEERWQNLSTKAQLLEKSGDSEGANEVWAQAFPKATAGQLYFLGQQLLGRGEVERAAEVAQKNAQLNPDAWIVPVGLARVASAEGKLDVAKEHLEKALEDVPDNNRSAVQGLLVQVTNGQSI
ncbi:MAG: DUF2911 domain-containing protein [Acidobacteriota bacterium]